VTRAPVQTFDLIGEGDIAACSANDNFEGVVFDLRRDWTTEHQTGASIVSGGGNNQRRAMACLFMT